MAQRRHMVAPEQRRGNRSLLTLMDRCIWNPLGEGSR